MPEIKPTIDNREIFCAETAPGPVAFVVFGASGDLVGRKLFVSLFQLFSRNLLNDRFYLLGCGRKKFSDAEFRKKAEQSIRDKSEPVSNKDLDAFISKLYYVDGDYNDTNFYEHIKTRLAELDKIHKVYEGLIYYLSVPPFYILS